MAERVRLLAAGDGRSSRPLGGTRFAGRIGRTSLRKVLELPRPWHVSSNLTSRTSRVEMAERVRFELTCRNYPTIRFRVGAVMTASVPLRTRKPLNQGRPA